MGGPLPGVAVKIIAPVDALAHMDEVSELGTGEIGEIIVRGPSVTRHYDKLRKRMRGPRSWRVTAIGTGWEIWAGGTRMGVSGFAGARRSVS